MRAIESCDGRKSSLPESTERIQLQEPSSPFSAVSDRDAAGTRVEGTPKYSNSRTGEECSNITRSNYSGQRLPDGVEALAPSLFGYRPCQRRSLGEWRPAAGSQIVEKPESHQLGIDRGRTAHEHR